jgi:membrane protease YdiL (CAAX protease family)
VLAILSYIAVTLLVYNFYVRTLGRPAQKPAAKVTAADQTVAERAPAKAQTHSNSPDPPTNGVVARTSNSGKIGEQSARESTHVNAPKPPVPGEKDSTFLPTEQMFLSAVTNSLLLVILPILVRATSGARLRDVGFRLEGWGQQAAVGVCATLIAIPVVYSIQFASILIWNPNAHELQKMLLDDFGGGTAYLAIVSAVILAPIVEELLFRGILQRWWIDFFMRRTRTPDLMTESVPVLRPTDLDGLVDTGRSASDEAPLSSHDFQSPEAVQSNSLPWHNSASVIAGIVITSLIFAVIHAGQWPAPIPLFVLALIIGSVYYRTGSLIAAICMHATFNGFSTLVAIVVILAAHEKEAKKAIEGERRVTAANVQVVQEFSGWMVHATRLENKISNEFLLDESVSD